MNAPVPTYRITPIDLPDADKKTLRAISPLLEALNRCLSVAVGVLNGLAQPKAKSTTFITDGAGAAAIELSLQTKPTELWLTALAPTEGAISTAFAMAWSPKALGARVSFFGLSAGTTYALTVRYF